jgi:hypothetical protein
VGLPSESASGQPFNLKRQQQSLFHNCTVESLNDNEVAFDVQLANLVRALKSAQVATSVTMKLAKNSKGLPIMNVAIDMQVSNEC